METKMEKIDVTKIILSVLVILLITTIFSAVPLAAQEKIYLKVGSQDEPKTLNPFKAGDVWSWNVIGWFYEPLYTREPITHKVIPWLAEGWPTFDGRVATVKMKQGIKWDDGTPLTAHDVKFTADVLLEFKVPRYYSDWEFIEKVEVVDDYTLKFYLKEECTPLFQVGTLMSLIVQKEEWEPIIAQAEASEEPLKFLLDYQIEKPVSAGPFSFVEWIKGSYVEIIAREDYWAKGKVIGDRTVGPFYDGILYKLYGTTDAAALALKKGEIDYIWWTIDPGFVGDLMKEEKIKVTSSPGNGLFYLAFNVRKKPFSDLAFREAFAYLVDKEFIVNRILQKYGEPAYTIVPPGNEFWYNPDTPKLGAGLAKEDRIAKAKEILQAAGYTWDDEGALLMPDGDPVQPFDILTPPADYDPMRAMSGMLIQEWVREAGMPATAKPTSFGTISQKVYTEQDFDVYILGWSLSLDPDYMKVFFHSSQAVPEGYNPMGYSNPEYDAIADASGKECDAEKRKGLIFKCQEMIMSELPYIPLYFRNEIEAYNAESFTGWFEDLGGISGSVIYLKPAMKLEEEKGICGPTLIILIALIPALMFDWEKWK
ncbi:MAG: ABC transporter substrate-binding protein [Candidatus Hydrothermarchaeales archaeon]